MKTILILGTLDTKGNQIQFLKKLIENAGHSVILMDNSTREVPALKADITCDEIALAAGVSIGELRRSKERVRITSVMTEGSIKKAQELFVEERFDAIVSLGGATAATVATAVMKALPFGIPKLMVCSAAGMPYAGKWFGTGDIQMMNTIVDLAGDNQRSRLWHGRGDIGRLPGRFALGQGQTARGHDGRRGIRALWHLCAPGAGKERLRGGQFLCKRV